MEVHQNKQRTAVSGDDDESENVEYLEEAICDDPNTFVDNFYPNAVYCLIDLYRQKFHEMLNSNKEEILQSPLWPHIAKDMNDSYFPFTAWQVQQKFQQLRRQYFSVTRPRDAESFEYFENMHEIYQDGTIDALSQGRAVPNQKANSYADDVLYVEQHQHVTEPNENGEILQVIERELKSLKKHTRNVPDGKTELPCDKVCALKRNHEIPEPNATPSKALKLSADMSLRQFNDEQERRHREHMTLLQQNVQLQQSILEQIDSLIKR